ncbi:MAG: pentapeptide repeat-containing protein [Cyanobacteria bacterium J06621_8]
MANPEHVAIARKGSQFLNQWQDENPEERLDLRGADLIKADLIEANLKGANFREANLRGADLIGADLIGAHLRLANLIGAHLSEANLRVARLREANLKGANFSRTDLVKANLGGANLRGANLRGANLSGADLVKANLKGTSAAFSIVDAKTLLNENEFDRKTDFSSVGLDSARIDEELKSDLKRNIRQIYWERRDKRNLFNWVFKSFWWVSDYGSSTKRLIYTFLGISLVFSVVYLIPYIAPYWMPWTDYPFLSGLEIDVEQYPEISELTETQMLWRLWIRTLYFSIVTMTTLGFGDMSAHPLSIPGHILVCIQVILGYVLLGALITRLSILFQEVQ